MKYIIEISELWNGKDCNNCPWEDAGCEWQGPKHCPLGGISEAVEAQLLASSDYQVKPVKINGKPVKLFAVEDK